MKDIRRTLLAAFRIEHQEHLEYIRGALARVEEGGPAWTQAELDEVFRRAHSLKGAARAVDLRPIEAVSHHLETLFGRMRTGTAPLNPAAIAVVHQALNAIEDWFAGLTDTAAPPEPKAVLEALDAYLAALAPLDEPISTPASERARQAPPASAAFFDTAVPRVAPPPPPPPPVEEPVAPRLPGIEDTVRIGIADLDRLLRSAGQLLTEGHGHESVSRRLRAIEAQLADLDRQWKVLRKAFPSDAGHRGADQLDAFSQTLRSLAKDARSTRLQQTRGGWTLRQLAGSLQNDVTTARMVPAEAVFGGFRKMLRDIARDEGKEVDFRLTGLEVRADRMVLQTLKDPVMHMLRNALFHGIEAADERRLKGKDPVGRVSLRFAVSGSRLELTIEDDGRGINYQRILQVAAENGFISPDEAEDASHHDIVRHIFRPGFSTAGQVTDLAGRGMGMSVVYQAVAQLNGSLDIPRKDGPGTTFRMLVPLSIATHRLMLVAVKESVYALPTDGIERLCRFKLGQVKTVEGRPMVSVDGRQLFLVSLAELLDLPDHAVATNGGVMPVIVLRSGDTRVAVAVDGFLSIRDGLIQDLGFPLPEGSKVAGGTLMEDGSVVIVVSPFQLVESCRSPDRAHMLSTVERSPVKKVPTILVVDDSFTTRTLEKSILVAHGYNVHVAVDGLEALSVLRAQPIDLVVADVQMPRLDGFGLLKEIKKDKVLAKTPLILVTSLESREDRERGLGLGASAYVVKRKFDQKELLETIEQLL